MNADELAAIPGWVEREVAKRNIPRLYAELASAVQSNANGSPQAFEPQKIQLIAAVEQVATNTLTDAQARFLEEKLKLLPHLGSGGIKEVEGILFRNSLDVATASSEMNKISNEVQSAIDRSNQIRFALSGLIEPSELPNDEILLRVVFDHGAAILNIVDLKKWAAEWHDIGRGIAMAVGATPKDLRVAGAQTGSIIITLATTYAIAKVVSSILLKALEVAERVQNLRKMQLEIQAMKLSNEQALDALKKQEAVERAEGLKSIGSSVSEGMKLDGEKMNALEKSIAKLLAFIEKGGEVDLVLPAQLDEQMISAGEEEKRLSRDVAKIRELERQQRLMPYLAAEEEENP